MLSGGEKGLSAIALLFAILKVTPSPFCIFDEVEAALDDVNVTRYAQYCRRMTRSTQFILITHRRGTMEEADVLYGITMQEEGVSKMLELKTAEMAKNWGLGKNGHKLSLGNTWISLPYYGMINAKPILHSGQVYFTVWPKNKELPASRKKEKIRGPISWGFLKNSTLG